MAGKTTSKALTPPKAGGAIAPAEWGKMAGLGFDQMGSEDYAIPFLSLLQPLSPQCTKGKPEYLPAAAPGMIFNSVTGQLWDGEKGVIIVPVDRIHHYGEWVPRTKGGGFRGNHAVNAEVVLKAKAAPGAGLNNLKSPDGNDLVEAFQLFALLLDSPEATEATERVVISFNSTKIGKYKQGMARLAAVKGQHPLFAHRVRLISVPQTNAKGSFFNFEFKPALGDSPEKSLIAAPKAKDEAPHPILLAGFEFLQAIRGNKVKVDYEKQGGREPGSDDGIF